MSLRYKIFLIIIATQLLLISVLALIFVKFSKQIAKEPRKQREAELVFSFNKEIKTKEERLENCLHQLSDKTISRNFLNLGLNNRNKYIQHQAYFQNFMLGCNLNILEIGDPSGKVHFRFHRPKDFGDDKGNQKIIREAMIGNISSALEIGHSGLGLRTAGPFGKNTILLGQVVDNRFASQLSLPDGVHFAIFHNDNPLAYSDSVVRGFIEENLRNRDFETISFRERQYYTLSFPYKNKFLLSERISFFLMVDETRLSRELSQISIEFFLIITFFLVISLLFSLLFSESLIRAIKNLSLSMKHFHEDKSETLNTRRQDEIGDMARSFQQMRSELINYQNNLEEIISVKTKEVEQRLEELKLTRMHVIQSLGFAAEYKDNETGLHVTRMSHYAKILSLGIGYSANSSEEIFFAAPMHDIGKIGIPDSILFKTGKLDADEWKIMKGHPLIGANIIGKHPNGILKMAREIALSHHEKWDGSGYPLGLKEYEICEEGRIVAIADVFDALTTVRPYKSAWSIEAACNYLMEESGKHFDPEFVEIFLNNLPEILKIKNEWKDVG